MVRLLLIRHAATDVSDRNLLVGSTDMEAGRAGLAKVKRLLPLLNGYEPVKWYCSPQRRAVQTAERLNALLPRTLEFEEDSRLREIDFGRWEQKTFSEIQEEDPDLIPAWSQYYDFAFPDGESVTGFAGRVGAFIGDMKKEEDVEIGVITHGGVIRTMICLALGLGAKNYLFFSVSPASLTILDLYPKGGQLVGLNL